MIRIPAISLILVLFGLLAVGYPAFAQGPPEQGGGDLSFSAKNDSNISQLLLESVGARSEGSLQPGAVTGDSATRDTVTRDSGKDTRSAVGAAGESADGNAPGNVGNLVRFDSTGNVQVYIHLRSTDETSLQQVRDSVVRVEIEAPEHLLIQAWVDPDELQKMAGLYAVKRITPPDYVLTKKGAKTTEGDQIHRADLVRAFSGLTGKGVRVGVISDGADAWTSARATGDLPTSIQTSADLRGEGHEGTAMMEIVHDMAPDARLAFAGPNTSVEMARAILWLANDAFDGEGADVVVDDLAFLFEPYFEDGIVAQAAADALAGGAVYVSSAGNWANQHYDGKFVDGGDGFHAFDGSSDISMRLLTPKGVEVYLQWNDQFGASGNDYDLYICRAGLRPTDFNLFNGFCSSSQDTQNGDDDPQETAAIYDWDEVDVFIKKDSGQGRRLKFYAVAFSFSGVQRSVSLAEHGVMEGGITQHEAVPGVLAVGAVSVGDPGNDDIVDYSDQGPSRIYFPTEETRMKPDVVASTCVSVTGSGGFPRTFCGTSAAAPHVAGIAALLVEAQRLADPTKTKKQVADAVTQIIRDTAIDLGPEGHDNQTGYGRADALAGVDSLGQLSGTGTTFTVNSTGDGADSSATDGICDDGSGNCTLRAAIEEANRAQKSIIKFDISGSGTRTIQPASFLPTVTGTVLIDGFSQSGASPTNYLVELDGTNVTTSGTSGLRISGANTRVRGLVINRYSSSGIVLEGPGGKQVIEENRIGTNAAGTVDSGNAGAGVLVSGAEGVTIRNNLISGNDSHGVELSSSSENALIEGNIIGADASGTSDLGNTGSGVHVTGADDATIFANVIVGNDSHGVNLTAAAPRFGNIYFCSSGIDIVDNLIGVNENGTSIPNGGSGVKVDNGADLNLLQGNTIAHNTADGITVVHDASIRCSYFGSSNRMHENSIHSNGGLGIDLNDDGVTANDDTDSDIGPNSLQNYPVLTHAALSAESAYIGFNMYVARYSTLTVDFYASDSCDSSGNGEGKEWLGHFTVLPETAGDKNYMVGILDGTLKDYNYSSSTYITATATVLLSTSEFSPCIESVSPPRLTLSKDTLEIEEDSPSNTTYTVRLASEPSHDATVDLSIDGDSVVTVSPTPLTFTSGSTGNWQTPQTVTVTALSDDDPEDEYTVIEHKLTIDSKEYIAALVPVEVKDDDVPAVAVTVDGDTGIIGTVNLNEGGTATYSVVLTEEPADNVVVDIDKWDVLQPSPSSLTFTKDNYSTAQDVTLTSINRWSTRDRRLGVHHRVDIGGIDYSVALVLANVEAAGFPGVIFSQRAITLNEGETATYTIVPAAEPAGNFTVRPESAQSRAVTVSPPSLSFTVGPDGNWETAQEVTVTALRDDDELDNVVPIVHHFNAYTPRGSRYFRLEDEVEVTVTDGNRAPYFKDGISTTREVPESAGQDANVGDPVEALDLNTSDTLTYTLEDASGKFSINSSTGQITVAASNSLDYETNTDYTVKVAVSDRTTDGLTDEISVKVVVTDVNEPPVITGEDSPTFYEDTNISNRVARYTAADPERDSFQWSVDGNDKTSFTIDTGGNLRFSTQPDREAKDTYEVTIVATDDGDPPSAGEYAVTVEVSDVDEPPVVTGMTTFANWQENDGSAIETYTAADPEGDTNISWSLGGTDRGDFTITGGVLNFASTPDYERPADSGRDNHYDVTIHATDSNSKRGELHVDVIVKNVDEPPVLTGPDSIDDFPENASTSRQVARYTATDPERATVTLSLAGADRDDFTLARNGVLTLNESPDYEVKSSYSVTVRAEAGIHTGNSATLKRVTVNLQNVEERGTVTLSTVQPQASTPLTATLEDDDIPSGTTWQWYRTSSRGSTGTAITNADSRFYTPDAGDVGRYLRAVASYDDGHGTGKSAYAVSANRVQAAPPDPEPPVFPSDGDYGRSIRENTRAGTNLGAPVRATDANNDRLTYSIPASDHFEIDASSGQLRTKVELDHEATPTLNITVTATDPGNETGTVTVTITVTDVNEGPEVSGRNSYTVEENQELSGAEFFATDPEGDSVARWSLSGTDRGDFNISQDGKLTFRNTPNYESPADSNRNNEYLVTVRASDGQYMGMLNVAVTVRDANEAPEFTSSSKSRTSFTYPENSTYALYTYRATDPEGGTITWSVSGTDRGDFDISERGALSFADVPDFEAPVDANGDNEYLVTVEARDDGFNFARLEVTVNVTNSAGTEEPTITTTSRPVLTFQENGTGAVYSYSANDPQRGIIAWSVTGTDAHVFTITSDSRGRGVLTFTGPPDFESPADSNGDNVYEITVVATDGQGLTDSFDVTVTVTNHAESAEPTISTRRPPTTYRENGTSTVYNFRASDPQRGPITWSRTGTDASAFALSDSGELSFVSPPDFESPSDSDLQNDYELTVVATDEDSHSDRLAFTITVTDVNEGPEITRVGSAPGSVAENYGQTQVLARYTAIDPEDTSAQISRWNTSGRDGGDFVMNEQGELRFRYSPDYERPADSNRDNVYEVTVRAYDGRYYGTFEETITVTPVNEPPTITTTITTTSRTSFGRGAGWWRLHHCSRRTGGSQPCTPSRATDPEGSGLERLQGIGPWWHRVPLEPGRDGGDFTINDTGLMTFRNVPDYERPADEPGQPGDFTIVGGALRFYGTEPRTRREGRFESPTGANGNEYQVTVRAEDAQGNPDTLEVTVTVTAVDEGPEVTGGGNSFTVQESQEWTGAIFTASDPEGGTVSRWSLAGRDGGDFTISETGLMTFRNVPDYERPADSNRDNVYEVTVRPYDGRNYGSHEVTVTVTPVNEPPTITTTSRTSFTQPENRISTLYTFRATDPEGGTVAWSAAGPDGGDFTIVGGALRFGTEPDFESPTGANGNEYQVTVRAEDAQGNPDTLEVTVTVTAVDEGPEVTGGGNSFTVQENQEWTGASFRASDPEGGTVSRWSLAGRDGGDFTISETGLMTFRNVPDYERPADSNRDNVYEVTVRPYDGRNGTMVPMRFTVTVTPVNEPPHWHHHDQQDLLYAAGEPDLNPRTLRVHLQGHGPGGRGQRRSCGRMTAGTGSHEVTVTVTPVGRDQQDLLYADFNPVHLGPRTRREGRLPGRPQGRMVETSPLER